MTAGNSRNHPGNAAGMVAGANRYYPERSRTYEISSDNKAFRPSCCSASLFGSCLDGTDQMVRLDWYMKDFGNKNGWAVDYCYLKDADENASE